MRLADEYKKIECAVVSQEIESVKLILQNSRDLYDLKNSIGETLIHLAVNHRCIELIHWLLQNHTDVNTLDFTQKTALHLAVSLKFDDVVECLLSYNAKIDIKDSYGNSPFHLAVSGGSVNIIKIFLNYGADVMDPTSKNLQTCFHLALLDENYEVFELLLKNYEGSLDVPNGYGETILHELARKKNKCLVERLLEKGVNFENVNQDQDTPLHLATHKRSYCIVELLLQYGANVNVTNKYNESPLHIAIRNRDVDLVRLLLSHGANAKALSSNKNSVLHLVMNYYNQEIFKILLNLDIDIDANNRDNVTPFHLAIATKNEIAARILVSKGANINSVSSKSWVSYQQSYRMNQMHYKNLSPLQTAIIHKDVDMVKFLLNEDVKINLENQTETFLAVDVASSEILELLLNYGANLNIKNEEGESLLYRAMKYCNIGLVQTLLINGANMQGIFIMGKSDEPVLHAAVKGYQAKFVQFLLNLGIDINFLDSKKHTALWYAKERRINIAEMLIRHIALLKVNNGFVNKQNQCILCSISYFSFYYTLCLAELDRLKEAKCCGISLILFLTRTEISLSKLLRSKDVSSEFAETVVSEKYPVYHQILVDKMVKAVKRWKLVKKATRILNSIGCFNTLYDIIDNILDNFSDTELEQLIQYCNNNDV